MNIREEYIFWDWNGTLLDDTEICMNIMNEMLEKRKMPVLQMDQYKMVFGFPVMEYYRNIGFDFEIESFEDLSVEFISGYYEVIHEASLADTALEVLGYFQDNHKRNVIVSAMEKKMLTDSVNRKKASGYFTDILGIDNIYAGSKSDIAMEFVNSNDLDPNNIVFIGDTTHDFEVAEEIGCRCILVADGHQSVKRLVAMGVEVIPTLSDLLKAIIPKSS